VGFTQLDQNTVVDEDGNKYYMPMGGAPADQGPATPEGSVPGMAGLPIPGMPAPQPTPSVLPSSAEPGPSLPPSGPGQPPDINLGKIIPAPPAVQIARASEQGRQAKLAAERNDLADYSAAGGTIDTGSDLAAAAGGQSLHEMETAKALSDATFDMQHEKNQNSIKMAGLTIQAANAQQHDEDRIEQAAQQRYKDWQQRNDKAIAMVVDPNHAFNDRSNLSKGMWSLAFIGAGMQGGAQVEGVAKALNQLAENDINAQKSNIENVRKGLDEGRIVNQEMYTTDLKGVEAKYAAVNLRLGAYGKALDAKIAEMGLPAAKAVGLLQARDTINKELLKNQMVVQDQSVKAAEERKKESFQEHLERLKSALKQQEDANRIGLEKKSQGVSEIATDTGLGLSLTDKNNNPIHGSIRLNTKPGSKEEIDAKNLLSGANAKATMLNEVRKDINTMSPVDLVRGGTPAFKQKIMSYAVGELKKISGSAVTPEEAQRYIQSQFGFDITGQQSAFKVGMASEKNVGPLKQGIKDAIDQNLRNISTETTNNLLPYVNEADKQKFNIQFNPQGTHVQAPDEGGETETQAEARVAGGGENPNAPLPTATPATSFIKNKANPYDFKAYEAAKESPRGAPGGLPVLGDKDEKAVNSATSDFAKQGSEEIIRLSKIYLAKKGLGPEAKAEIELEAHAAIKSAIDKEQDINTQLVQEFERNKGNIFPDLEEKNPPGFAKWLEANKATVNEMRANAGLPPE